MVEEAEVNEGRVFLNVHEVAARYGVSAPTIWHWMRNGLIPEPHRFTPSCSRWALVTLQEFEANLDEQRVPRRLWELKHRQERQTKPRRTK